MHLVDHDFEVRVTPTLAVIRGFAADSLWFEFTHSNGHKAMDVEGGDAHGFVGFRTLEKFLPLYFSPSSRAPTEYSVHVKSTQLFEGMSRPIVRIIEFPGYSVEDLFDQLDKPELLTCSERIRRQYVGVGFMQNRVISGFEVTRFIGEPLDRFRLPVTVTVVPARL